MSGHTEHLTESFEEMIAQLEWYQAAGVDLCVGDAPVDQFLAHAEAKAPSIESGVSTPNASGPNPGSPPRSVGNFAGNSLSQPTGAPAPLTDEVTNSVNPDEAKALAAGAKTLDELRGVMAAYDGCPLKLRATQLVFADGNPQANIMLIGEAPGREEDLQGKPFVGPAGQLLDKMLAAIGIDRTKIYIANTVPWRPPGNRTPTPDEISVCLPFLHRQIELVGPDLIITAGAAATQTMFGEKLSIIKTRGKWRDLEIGDHKVRVMPTLHPAFLLRQPLQKRSAWRDLLAVKHALESLDNA